MKVEIDEILHFNREAKIISAFRHWDEDGFNLDETIYYLGVRYAPKVYLLFQCTSLEWRSFRAGQIPLPTNGPRFLLTGEPTNVLGNRFDIHPTNLNFSQTSKFGQ